MFNYEKRILSMLLVGILSVSTLGAHIVCAQEADPHEHTINYEDNGENHILSCAECEYLIEEEHTFDEKGVCICGAVKEEEPSEPDIVEIIPEEETLKIHEHELQYEYVEDSEIPSHKVICSLDGCDYEEILPCEFIDGACLFCGHPESVEEPEEAEEVLETDEPFNYEDSFAIVGTPYVIELYAGECILPADIDANPSIKITDNGYAVSFDPLSNEEISACVIEAKIISDREFSILYKEDTLESTDFEASIVMEGFESFEIIESKEEFIEQTLEADVSGVSIQITGEMP